MYKILLSLLATVLSAKADSLTISFDPTETITHNPCNTPLTPYDTDNSWGNPCPGYFDPLPTQGALSGQYLTLFGFPALNDFSGSVVATDDKSTTYAITCLDTDVVNFIGGQCSSTGHVVSITASGWEWHMTTSSTDTGYYSETYYESMTLSINPSGHIDYTYIESGISSSHVSTYRTTHTWTGNVAIADPTIVPIVGLAKIGGSDAPFPSSTSRNKSPLSTSASNGAVSGNGGSATTPAPSQLSVSAATSGATSRASGAAAPVLASRLSIAGDHMWLSLGASVLLVASLAILL